MINLPLAAAHRRSIALLCAAALAFTLAAPRADAGRGAVDVEHFNPQIDGRGLFTAEGADTLPQWQFGAAAWLHFARNPLVVSDGVVTRTALVGDRLTLDAGFAIGLLDWLELGVALPLALLNDQNAGLSTSGAVGVTGFGSMRLELKLKLLDETRHGLGLALLPRVFLPTGNHNAFLGQNFVVFSPMLVIERSLGSAVRVLANIGYTVREQTAFNNIVVDDELFFSLGLGWKVHRSVELGIELSGATAASDLFGANARKNPLEALLGLRFLLSSHFQLFAGGGPGLSTGYGSPTYRLFAGLVFAPHEKDSDGDGVPDSIDRCPNVKGVKEQQGCPWPDSDGDGVTDDLDKCPKIPGPKENQGCPWPDADSDGVPDKDDKCPLTPGPKDNAGCPWPDKDGDGIPDKDDKCPTLPGPKENQGCPWPDTDQDGVLDKDDKCPTVPGPAANQGCPWEDTDKDGVLDKDDKCPTVPGPAENQGCPWQDSDKDGVPDKDDECPTESGPASNKGCPSGAAVATKTEIRVEQPISFQPKKAKVRRKSFALLAQVAAAMKRNPHILLLEIQVHTDDTGDRQQRIALSQKRADAVRSYLRLLGVSAKRLSAKGYGPTQPLVAVDAKKMSKEALAVARAKNRRVRFVLLRKRVLLDFNAVP